MASFSETLICLLERCFTQFTSNDFYELWFLSSPEAAIGSYRPVRSPSIHRFRERKSIIKA